MREFSPDTPPSRPARVHLGASTHPQSFDFRSVVLQPTTVCNLNCSYCYLPGRAISRRMSPRVAIAVASSLSGVPHHVDVLWHGGEPLACGLAHIRELLAPFSALREAARVKHSLQTNATLLTPEWCQLLLDEGFQVGVSVDGGEAHNTSRVDWAGKSALPATLRGIDLLRAHEIDFGVIAVVNPANVGDPAAFYEFFLSLGCKSLNINVEEREGLNRNQKRLGFDQVVEFWKGLFEAWRANPVLRVREFHEALGWMQVISGEGLPVNRPLRNMWPTVSHDGNVVVLAPELMAADEAELPQFVVGNVLESGLPEIVARAERAAYVRDFWRGVAACRRACAYFSFCGGGHASNKYFELGTTNATETDHCRFSRQAVIDAIVTSLENEATMGGEHEGAIADTRWAARQN